MATATTTQSPGTQILTSILREFRDRLSIDAASKILVTDPQVATLVSEICSDIATPYGPHFTIATAEPTSSSGSSQDLGPLITQETIEDLQNKMDHFTHAITDISSASGKTALEIMKWAKYALQPKGILVVVALKKTEEGGDFVERMQAQSKNRISGLGDILEWAGFERGKIRRLDRSADGGEEAEVVLGMKWDQLTA